MGGRRAYPCPLHAVQEEEPVTNNPQRLRIRASGRAQSIAAIIGGTRECERGRPPDRSRRAGNPSTLRWRLLLLQRDSMMVQRPCARAGSSGAADERLCPTS